MGGGGVWEFSLVQGSKIHLNELWYRLRVPGTQRHIPTQNFLKYPPPLPVGKPLSALIKILKTRPQLTGKALVDNGLETSSSPGIQPVNRLSVWGKNSEEREGKVPRSTVPRSTKGLLTTRLQKTTMSGFLTVL